MNEIRFAAAYNVTNRKLTNRNIATAYHTVKRESNRNDSLFSLISVDICYHGHQTRILLMKALLHDYNFSILLSKKAQDDIKECFTTFLYCLTSNTVTIVFVQ